VFVKQLPSNQGSYGALSGNSAVTCDSVWNLVYDDTSTSSVSFSFWRVGSSKQDLSRRTLPHEWLAKNSVVTEEYPRYRIIPESPFSTMAKIQVPI
jgi:hypothetical protein